MRISCGFRVVKYAQTKTTCFELTIKVGFLGPTLEGSSGKVVLHLFSLYP